MPLKCILGPNTLSQGPWLDALGQGSEISLQLRVLTDVLAKDEVLVETAAHTKGEAVSSGLY